MTEIRFYHLQKQTLDQVLPQILTKALAGGHRIAVKLPDMQAVEQMNGHLWTYAPDSFLPHGSAKDGNEGEQPIFLTYTNDNPNESDVLITGHGAEPPPEEVENYTLCCEMLNGFDEESVTAARGRWKTYKDKGFDVTYWQQSETGKWEKKA